MIKRFAESKLNYLIKKFPVVGIIGPRQSGKTTLAKIYRDKIKTKSVYLDLENPDDMLNLQNPTAFFKLNPDKLIIIDEVQTMPGLFPILRSIVDSNPKNGRFLLLGSASPHLIKGTSQSLSGRIAYIELNPFNLLEIYSSKILTKHWFRGGFPKSFLAKNEKDSKLWLDNIIRTYIERDFNLLGLDIGNMVARNLLTMLGGVHGGILNISDLSRSMGLSVPTIKRYLEFLSDAFLIRLLQPFYVNIGKRLVKAPKMYVRDCGMLHRLNGISEFKDLMRNILIGRSWEGYVIEQISQLKNDDVSLYYYRTHKGIETDLVFTKSNKPVALVEIKYSPNPDVFKSFRSAIKDLNSNDNYIITPNSENYLLDRGIRICSIKDFLTGYLNKIK